MKTRRKFLKEVCPTVAFAFFGLSFLEACSTEEAETNGPVGFVQNGNVYTIDLTNSNFSALATVGGWMNGHSLGLQMLFLRISNDNIQAYSNKCPHNGLRDDWELSGESFRCNYHGNSYSNDCSDSAGSLSCYNSLLEGGSLIVTV